MSRRARRAWFFLTRRDWPDGWRVGYYFALCAMTFLTFLAPTIDPAPVWQHDLVSLVIGWPLTSLTVGWVRDVVDDVRGSRS